MSKNMIELREISKKYSEKKEETTALKQVSLIFPEKGFIFIKGRSGSGKTTLMNLLAGIDRPSSGEIFFEGQDITNQSERVWDQYRNLKVGIVFQSFNLIDDMSVWDNVLLPLKIQDIDYKEKVVKEALEYVGLQNYQNRKCSELSAGQKQRVAIARAVIKNPKVVLADEATGNLDPENANAMLQLLNNISKERLVILISHDELAAYNYGDRIITLSDGEIVEDIDNSQIKNLSENIYSVNIEVEEDIETISLNEFDLKKEITKRAKWNGEAFSNFMLKMSIEYKGKPKNSSGKPKKMRQSKVKKLPQKDVVLNSLYCIKKGKSKTILTLALITFICTLFLFIYMFTTNDYDFSIYKYLKADNVDLVSVEQHIDTDMGKMVISKGRTYLENLNLVMENEILKCVSQEEIFGVDKDESELLDLFYAEHNDFLDGKKLEGNYPQKNNQIALCKSLAKKMNIGIGGKVKVRDTICEVSGILDLNVSEVENYGIISENVVNDYIRKLDNIPLQGVDIILSADKSEYADGIQTIGRISQGIDNSESLVWGREPKSNNEIIISSNFAENLGGFDSGDIILSYRIPDLYDEKYKNQYSQIINLYDYIGKKVEIVGVYDSKKYPESANIILRDDVYQDIVSDYIKYLNYDKCLVMVKDNMYDCIRKFSEKDFELVDSVCNYLYYFKGITDTIKSALYIIVVVLFVVLTVMLISFLSYSVREQARRIGILRVVGVDIKDIEKIYMINSIIISCISVVLSNFIVAILVRFLNSYAKQKINVEQLCIFTINGINQLVLSVAIIGVSVIVTAIPLVKMSRKKTIVLLNDE